MLSERRGPSSGVRSTEQITVVAFSLILASCIGYSMGCSIRVSSALQSFSARVTGRSSCWTPVLVAVLLLVHILQSASSISMVCPTHKFSSKQCLIGERKWDIERSSAECRRKEILSLLFTLGAAAVEAAADDQHQYGNCRSNDDTDDKPAIDPKRTSSAVDCVTNTLGCAVDHGARLGQAHRDGYCCRESMHGGDPTRWRDQCVTDRRAIHGSAGEQHDDNGQQRHSPT